ncbi:hypothetical protein K474DRAFT_399199 [Panus rudis PR-1116 ss-1]|nr:hypothetical protein K474DRAFT_399199 [Panus rudis PR-1116 ss-1]
MKNSKRTRSQLTLPDFNFDLVGRSPLKDARTALRNPGNNTPPNFRTAHAENDAAGVMDEKEEKDLSDGQQQKRPASPFKQTVPPTEREQKRPRRDEPGGDTVQYVYHAVPLQRPSSTPAIQPVKDESSTSNFRRAQSVPAAPSTPVPFVDLKRISPSPWRSPTKLKIRLPSVPLDAIPDVDAQPAMDNAQETVPSASPMDTDETGRHTEEGTSKAAGTSLSLNGAMGDSALSRDLHGAPADPNAAQNLPGSAEVTPTSNGSAPAIMVTSASQNISDVSGETQKLQSHPIDTNSDATMTAESGVPEPEPVTSDPHAATCMDETMPTSPMTPLPSDNEEAAFLIGTPPRQTKEEDKRSSSPLTPLPSSPARSKPQQQSLADALQAQFDSQKSVERPRPKTPSTAIGSRLPRPTSSMSIASSSSSTKLETSSSKPELEVAKPKPRLSKKDAMRPKPGPGGARMTRSATLRVRETQKKIEAATPAKSSVPKTASESNFRRQECNLYVLCEIRPRQAGITREGFYR